jgi:RNA polymerase sigma-70 factor (ECF subfamily)
MESDLSLLNAAKRLDRDALVKIFDLYASPLYRYALRLCGDPSTADHIVGDVFAKLLDQLASGKGPSSNLRSYLYEMAYHNLIDEVRSSRRRVPLDALTSLRSNGHSRLAEVEDPIQLEMIQEAIQHDLTDDQRHVIVLRFLEEFSLRETAAILGKDINHVKVIQSRALAKLRQVLESKDFLIAISLPRTKELTKASGL